MIVINTINSNQFSINGVYHNKIYQPLAVGTNNVAIYNTYDTRFQLLSSTPYDEFTVNDTTYGSQATLMSALLLVIYTPVGSGEGGSASSGSEWGEITGTLSAQGDLQSALDGKEDSFSKNTGFNKNLGTSAGTVSEGNHTHTFSSLTSKPTTISGYGITDTYSKTEADNKYLLNTTDTLTGDFTATGNIQANIGIFNGASPIRLRGSASGNSNFNYIQFYESDGTTRQAYIGLPSSADSDFYIFNEAGSNYFRVLDDGGADGLRYNWSGGSGTIWHSGNDGSGSGLNADLLDDLNSEQFLRSDTTDIFSGTTLQLSSSSTLRVDKEVINHGITFWRVSTTDQAAQRCDSRDDDTTKSRLHWYGLTDAAATSNFRHAYYDGSTYINVTAESGGVTFGGNLTATAFYESSDKTFKTNIKEISPTFRTFERKDELGRIRYGVIAQEVEKTHPELVNTDEDGIKSVNYVDLLVMKVAELENKIIQLENNK